MPLLSDKTISQYAVQQQTSLFWHEQASQRNAYVPHKRREQLDESFLIAERRLPRIHLPAIYLVAERVTSLWKGWFDECHAHHTEGPPLHDTLKLNVK